MQVVSGMRENILQARYYLTGETRFEDVCRRVASAIGSTAEERRRFYHMMAECDFLPNSPCLMNAGTRGGQLSACFVLPVGDTLEEIFETIKNAALIHKTGGGTGFSFGNLRPAGSAVNSSAGVSSGPVSFMKVFDAATGAVRQGGRRRGANMAVLPIWHPDIREFILCKTEEGELKNFNISVMVDDAFMEDPDDELFGLLAESIHRNGEPGVIFYDRINEANVVPHLGTIEATNPCGEQPLLPYESCTLGSLNLSHYLDAGAINRKKLEEDTRSATRFLDNVIDHNRFPIQKIAEMTKKTRKIGLGVMGFHDLLLNMDIPYDSAEALKLAGKVFGLIKDTAMDESNRMALESGTFPEWENSTWDIPLRNATLTCIAPTGSTSLIAGCSSGIEPVFSWVCKRCRTVGGEYMMVHPFFKERLHELRLTEEEYNRVISHAYKHGSVQDCDILPGEFRRLFVSSLDITPKKHIDMQAAFQTHCHAAISKTINLPEATTTDGIMAAIRYAWTKGLKGLTMYRTGSRTAEVLELDKQKMPKKPLKKTRPVSETAYWCQRVCSSCR